MSSPAKHWCRLTGILIGAAAGVPTGFGGTQSILGTTPAQLELRSLAAACGGCHGTDGRALRGLGIPRLAGLPHEYFSTRMRAFRADKTDASVMHQVASGFSDSQIEALAVYFERVDSP